MIEKVQLHNGEYGYILTRTDLIKSGQDLPINELKAAHIAEFDFMRDSAFVVIQDDDMELGKVGSEFMIKSSPRFFVVLNKYGPSSIIVDGIFDPYDHLDLSFGTF